MNTPPTTERAWNPTILPSVVRYQSVIGTRLGPIDDGSLQHCRTPELRKCHCLHQRHDALPESNECQVSCTAGKCRRAFLVVIPSFNEGPHGFDFRALGIE